jgi:hypothetical protein
LALASADFFVSERVQVLQAFRVEHTRFPVFRVDEGPE